jgi:hypothetical protein
MRSICGASLVLVSFAACVVADERIPIRVLYCGNSGSEREVDFRSFLERHFTNVTVRNLNAFKEDDTKEQDVILFDWTNGYNGKGMTDWKKWESLDAPLLSKRFSRPAILIGRAGGQVAMRLNLKIDWLCLCLNGPAHHLRLNHPVFHSPLIVDPKFDVLATPSDYPELTIDPSLSPTMKVWHVQTRNYPTIDPGLVSTLYGFDDSPDAEVIAQGVAGKGPDTVALGRHANFFLWGFSAPPADMYPAAQRLFINVICYMRRFDGSRPIVRRSQQSREWALRYAIIARELSDAGRRERTQELRAVIQKHPEFIPKESRGNIDAFVAEQVDGYRKSQREAWERQVPERLRKRFGTNAEKYLSYYRDNLEYLHPNGPSFDVDEDVKLLGVSNRRVELLDRCVAMLERNDRPELARSVLTRYTDEVFRTPSEWRTWLDQNRDGLFFSDVGGYKFFVDTARKQSRKGARPGGPMRGDANGRTQSTGS